MLVGISASLVSEELLVSTSRWCSHTSETHHPAWNWRSNKLWHFSCRWLGALKHTNAGWHFPVPLSREEGLLRGHPEGVRRPTPAEEKLLLSFGSSTWPSTEPSAKPRPIDELLWKSGQNATGAETMWRLRPHPEIDFFLWQTHDYLYLSITVLQWAASKDMFTYQSGAIKFAVNITKT